ncbi:MAG: glutamyl-tRNA reductase [Gammaproteobacteria bacterium]|nr:glutamyl-tRNA reductase [Gammaproteobacteria bacterium]
MSIFAFGVNHTTAPLAVRERVSLTPDSVPSALRELVGIKGVNEATIVSTCNRTDLYCELADDSSARAIDWFRNYHELEPSEILPYLYQHRSAGAVRHLLRVASGLDSLVLGEPQILGQVKDAHRLARDTGAAGRVLDRLFQHSFSVAKKVRTTTSIGANAVSVAYAAVSLAKQIFGDLRPTTALMLGAGETVELACRHLTRQSVGRLIIANRTVTNAQRLASNFSGFAISLDELPNHLAEADILICSTGSSDPIIRHQAVADAIQARKHRPMFIVDIAVPRDVENEVGELDDVYLYTVDDLEEVISENRKSRAEAAKLAEELVDGQVSEVMGWLDALDVGAAIATYRSQAEVTRDAVLIRAEKMLAKGDAPEKVMGFVANTLMNKLLHAPTSGLRRAASDGRVEVVEAAHEILGLDASSATVRNDKSE